MTSVPPERRRAAPPASATRKLVATPERLRLLIVDDDFLFTDMLPRQLRKDVARPAFEVAAARSPEEALALLAEREFDVVLCDFDLKASQTGLHVLERAARDQPDAFRVLISGHAPRDIPSAPEGTHHALLEKPMTLREVVPLLAALLSERLGVAFHPHR